MRDSTAGYASIADQLVVQYESITFEEVHGQILHLLPAAGRALDIGAGTGRDAAALARRGFRVTAAEPTAEMAAHGQRLHAGLDITWIDDALPQLPQLAARGESYDLIMLTAVWMHLDATERGAAMQAVAPLLANDGRLAMTLRHGPVPPGRRMFEVSAEDVIAAAQPYGIELLYHGTRGDMLSRDTVHWDVLVLTRP
ncbi:class I SAM-dependent methyltransferase [Ferrovibrio terrae]|uniref:Class I SAM-dependent methyltransferase n=1 Tax=Ferrovibrio terrae TaxID=2594003 RepID=A0A516GXS6_9PROT|nr:class I SAM-dependent methyltransferase [Ferrovibrio terrae]QDO96140.1 class I SAM-dependent methyltransferase [Ferrovibrio terrae]